MQQRFPRRASGWLRRYFPAATCICFRAIIRKRRILRIPGGTFSAEQECRGRALAGGWLSYRQGLYTDAARLFDEQIRLYPSATDTVAALYWRGRLYEAQEHNPAAAAANYRAIVRAYQHFFYAQMARQRLAALGSLQPVADPDMDALKAPDSSAARRQLP